MSSTLRSHFPATFSTLLAVLLCAAALLPAEAQLPENTNNQTVFSNSSITTQSVISTGTGAASYLTQLRTLGQQPPGFDLSFGKALSDPSVQAAITAARNILIGAGVPASIANQGPVRAASSLTSYGPAGAVTGSQTAVKTTVSTFIGPQTIHIGANQATPFVLAGGQVDIDVLTDTHTDIFQSLGGSLLNETYVIPIDLGAVLSLAQSGLPVALVQREALLAVEQTVGQDINGRLFRLRAGSVGIRSEGDVEEGGRGMAGPKGKTGRAVEPPHPGWEFFASGDFANADQNQRGRQTGFGSNTQAATVGAEYAVAPGLTLGLGVTWLENRTTLSGGLGTLDIEGFALSAYASYVRAPFYADLLYRFGDYEDSVRRNTLFGASARATPQAYHHTVEFHTGANFHLGPVVTGPMLGVSYTHGTLDGYTETGAGSQNTSVGTQRYDSLRSEVGWQASQRVPVRFGAATWQLRASWERENLNNSDSVGVGLVDSPLFAVTADGSLQRTGSLTLRGNTTRAGDDYLALGGGLLFEIGPRTKVLLDYEEHLGRTSRSERVGAVRVSVGF